MSPRSAGPALPRLIELMARLPGLGPRSARRAVLFLLKRKDQILLPLADALREAGEKIDRCTICGHFDTNQPCALCQADGRVDGIICVVEDVPDLWALERGGAFRGRYHVLGGVLSAIDGIGPDDLKIAPLIKRLEKGAVREILIATKFNVEGDATALYLAKRIQPLGLRITSLAYSIPMGSELEYVDEATVNRAVEGRRDI